MKNNNKFLIDILKYTVDYWEFTKAGNAISAINSKIRVKKPITIWIDLDLSPPSLFYQIREGRHSHHDIYCSK